MYQLLFALLVFSLSELNGHWREISRRTPDGKEVAFTDTTFYEFQTGNQWLRGRVNSFQYRGVYKLENNKLDLGVQIFDMVRMDDRRMVLKDELGQYTFERYTPSSTGLRDGMDASASSSRAQEPSDLEPVLSLSVLQGKWQPFKRTSARTLDKVDYNRQIKAFVVYDQPQAGRLGEIYGGMDPANVPTWYIESYQKGVLTAVRKDGSDHRTLKVLSFKDGELIFVEDPVTYFLKRF